MPSIPIPLPFTQTAVVARGPGQLAIQHDAPVPTLAADMVLIKSAAVAINPADAKMLDYSAAAGAVHGYDFAGTIVALGADAPAHLAVGDRVAGLVHGMNALRPEVGAFAEYVGATGDLLLKIPEVMSFEDAASLGTGVATAGLGLFKELNVPGTLEQPTQKARPPFVLVCGGSTATGTRALQMLKLAGFRPLATCSPTNFVLARSFGAEQVFDYHSSTCAQDIRSYTSNTLGYALDCVSQADTTQLCQGAIGRAGGRYVALEPYREKLAVRKTVEYSWLMVLTIFGLKVALDGVYGREARPEDREFGKGLFREVQRLLDQGRVTTHPVKVMGGGWEGVVKGVDVVRKGELSGYKLVYRVA